MTDTVSRSIESIELDIKKLDQEMEIANQTKKTLEQKKKGLDEELYKKLLEKYSIVIRKEWSDYLCKNVPFKTIKGNGMFTASNGITICCGGDWTPGFEIPDEDTLYTCDGQGRGGPLNLDKPWIPGKDEGRDAFIANHARIVKAIAELEKKYNYLREEENRKYSIVIRKEWSDFIFEKYPHSPFKGNGKFVASNGITIVCGNNWTPEFHVYTASLYTCDGQGHGGPSTLDKPWIPPGKNEGRDAFIANHASIVKAIAELEKKYNDYILEQENGKYSIIIRKEWNDYVCEKYPCSHPRLVRGKFVASNGITICCGEWSPGFEIPDVDTLYTCDGRVCDDSILDKPWIPSKENGRDAFIAKHERIVKAIIELSQEYEASLKASLDAKMAPSASTGTKSVPESRDSSVPTKASDRFRTSVETMEKLGFDRKASIRALLDCNMDLVDAISALSK